MFKGPEGGRPPQEHLKQAPRAPRKLQREGNKEWTDQGSQRGRHPARDKPVELLFRQEGLAPDHSVPRLRKTVCFTLQM